MGWRSVAPLVLCVLLVVACPVLGQIGSGNSFLEAANLFEEVGNHTCMHSAPAPGISVHLVIYCTVWCKTSICALLVVKDMCVCVCGLQAEFLDLGLQLELDSVIAEGDTPARVVIDRAVSFPAKGDTDLIVLRNLGGKTVDLRGWFIRDGNRVDKAFTIEEERYGDLVDLVGGEAVEFRPATQDNPCGFEFGLSYR